MKKGICTAVLLIVTIVFAIGQKKESGYRKKTISKEISNSKAKQKLQLQVDDEYFNLQFRFDKKQTDEVHRILTAFIGDADFTKTKKEWNYKTPDFSISSSRGKLKLKIAMDQISTMDHVNIKTCINGIFNHLGWDSYDLGLWSFSGDWNINID